METLSENQAIGVYTGYVGSHLGSYLSGQSVGVNGGQTGIYLRRDDGRNYYILLGGMGADGYNSRRLMQFGGVNTTATANYGGWQSQAYLERGITLQGSQGFDPALRRAPVSLCASEQLYRNRRGRDESESGRHRRQLAAQLDRRSPGRQ